MYIRFDGRQGLSILATSSLFQRKTNVLKIALRISIPKGVLEDARNIVQYRKGVLTVIIFRANPVRLPTCSVARHGTVFEEIPADSEVYLVIGTLVPQRDQKLSQAV